VPNLSSLKLKLRPHWRL